MSSNKANNIHTHTYLAADQRNGIPNDTSGPFGRFPERASSFQAGADAASHSCGLQRDRAVRMCLTIQSGAADISRTISRSVYPGPPEAPAVPAVYEKHRVLCMQNKPPSAVIQQGCYSWYPEKHPLPCSRWLQHRLQACISGWRCEMLSVPWACASISR